MIDGTIPASVKQLIVTSTVKLVYVDGDERPVGGGSGCLVDYYGKRYLLTVEHVTEIPRTVKLYVELGWNAMLRRTEIVGPGPLTYIRQGKLPADFKDLSDIELKFVDLAYYEVNSDCNPQIQQVRKDGSIAVSNSCRVFDKSNTASVVRGEFCGFSGHTAHETKWKPEISKEVYLQSTVFRTCYGIQFEESDGDFAAFKLPSGAPQVGYFEGCSGAPIINASGKVVALVSHGRSGEDYVFAVPIEKYFLVLDTNRLLEQWADGGKPYLED